MAKKKAEAELQFFYYDKAPDTPFPRHVLFIVDGENNRMTILDAKKMDVWAEVKGGMPPSSNG